MKHRFINMKATSSLIPDKIGIISYYNPDNGEINIKYNNDILITHISRCKMV